MVVLWYVQLQLNKENPLAKSLCIAVSKKKSLCIVYYGQNKDWRLETKEKGLKVRGLTSQE